jgi:hypothetical protein
MSGPTKRNPARKRTAAVKAVPSPPPEVPDRATLQQQRIDRLITVDQGAAIQALTEALGRAQQQIVMNSVLITRLINHILAIDPDDKIAQQVQKDQEEAGP